MHRTAKSSHRMYGSSQIRIFFIAVTLCGFGTLANPATAAPGAFPCRGNKTQYQPDQGALWTNDIDCDSVIFAPTTRVQIGKDAGSTRITTSARYEKKLPAGSGLFVVFLTADNFPLGSIWFGGLKAADCTNETLNRTGNPASAPPQMRLLDFDDLHRAKSVQLFLWTGSDDYTKC